MWAQPVVGVVVGVGWVVVWGSLAGVPQALDIHPMGGGADMAEAAEAAEAASHHRGSKAMVVRCHPC
ncbi:hypothetical protein ACK38U_02080 [Aeromonas veronii]